MSESFFFRVQSGVIKTPNDEIRRNPDGTFVPTPEFADKVIESDERFRSAVITFINDAVQQDWAVRFVPVIADKEYFVDIYSETVDDYKTIVEIVKERIKNLKITFWYKGTVKNI